MRHGLQDEAACALCDQADETTDHLLTACVFSREVWFRLLCCAGLLQLAPDSGAVRAWRLVAPSSHGDASPIQERLQFNGSPSRLGSLEGTISLNVPRWAPISIAVSTTVGRGSQRPAWGGLRSNVNIHGARCLARLSLSPCCKSGFYIID